jgi:protein import protein ZIM17
MVQTKGAISIMDRVPGVKAENGELYVLSFTCTKCETKQIRSFTKHAYHKGVVLVRCGGCENIHLVADNIGWFEDTPINIETMHQGKVKRIQDPIVIGKFLETAFK